ncbi:Ubiquitin-like protein, partial [Imshaugia aleurites]
MSNPPSPSISPPIPDDPNPSPLPLPLSASLILTSLPQDATTALARASDDDVPPKVTIRFQPVGSAPPLRQKVVKVTSTNRFETVVAFLSKKLKGVEGVDAGGGGGGG